MCIDRAEFYLVGLANIYYDMCSQHFKVSGKKEPQDLVSYSQDHGPKTTVVPCIS